MHENDSLNGAGPNRTPPRHATLHQVNPGDGDASPGAGVLHRHRAIQRLAGLSRLFGLRAAIAERGFDRDGYGTQFDPHELAIIGERDGPDCDGDTGTNQGAEVNSGSDPDMPTAGPERPGPYLLYSHRGTDAATNECPVDPQTAADLWHNSNRRLSDGGT